MNRLKTLCIFVFCVVGILCLSTIVLGQSNSNGFFTMTSDATGIKFFEFSSGAYTEIASLPSNIAFAENNPSAQWQIRSDDHLRISPNGELIAFSASDGISSNLFIYIITDGSINQINIISETLLPLWSPDSTALVLRPEFPFTQSEIDAPETYIYDLETSLVNQITFNTSYIEREIEWLPDSTGIVYASRCVEVTCNQRVHELYYADRSGNTITRITTVSSHVIEDYLPVGICNIRWNPYNERWYFQVDCLDLFEYPKNHFFSTTLNGDLRLELFLPDIFNDEELRSIAANGLEVNEDNIFIPLERDRYSERTWSIVLSKPTGETSIVFDLPWATSGLEMQFSRISPDGVRFGLVGIESYEQSSLFKVINTTTGSIEFETTFNTPTAICYADWIDSNRAIIETRTVNCREDSPIENWWEVDLVAGTMTDVYIPDHVLIPLQRNIPSTANAGTDQTIGILNSTASVTLDGSGSSDADGSIVSYVWTDSTGTQVATGVSPTVDLPIGTHEITLTVTDDDGATATDEVIITVK